jgi:hypothetical protein
MVRDMVPHSQDIQVYPDMAALQLDTNHLADGLLKYLLVDMEHHPWVTDLLTLVVLPLVTTLKND